MKKKTIEKKYHEWIRREYNINSRMLDNPILPVAYKAGHKSAAIELGKQLREKDERIEGLKKAVIQLVEACEGYAKDTAEMEASVNAADAERNLYWEETRWSRIELGDCVCYIHGDASRIWRAK